MLTVAAAFDRLFAITPTMEVEHVSLADAGGRILRRPMVAARDQPPFSAAAMDGYAIATNHPHPGDTFEIIGESAAGRRFGDALSPGTAVRIFTGAPLPEGAVRVLVQEDVICKGKRITLNASPEVSSHIRPSGGDFRAGAALDPPLRLSSAHVSLLAAMGMATIPVSRFPRIALLTTGNELVHPGGKMGTDQIAASNAFGLKTLLESEGARAQILPIADDTLDALNFAFDLAEGSDLTVAVGGASVGKYDLIRQVAEARGIEMRFHRIAMRPGKPMMAGCSASMLLICLPGNPVSALVCANVFLRPMIRGMLGLRWQPLTRRQARLKQPLGPGSLREHYQRAQVTDGWIAPFERQDSSLLSILAQANALLIQPPGSPPMAREAVVDYLPLGGDPHAG